MKYTLSDVIREITEKETNEEQEHCYQSDCYQLENKYDIGYAPEARRQSTEEEEIDYKKIKYGSFLEESYLIENYIDTIDYPDSIDEM